MLKLGVIADTHIPDRVRELPPKAEQVFRRNGVHAILHAGDISTPRLLSRLEEIAPVYAVRGNRDWFGFGHLPKREVLTIGGLTIGMTHGHGGWREVVTDRLRYLLRGPQDFGTFARRAVGLLPREVDVVIFGHTHAPMNFVQDGQLVFNPGSPCCPSPRGTPPTVGLLFIKGRRAKGMIVNLQA